MQNPTAPTLPTYAGTTPMHRHPFFLASDDHHNTCNRRTSTVVFSPPPFPVYTVLTSILQLCRRQCLLRRCVQLQRQMRRRGRKRKWENKIGLKFPVLFLTKRTSFQQYFQPFLSILSFYSFQQQQPQQQNSHSKATNAQAKKVIFPSFLLPSFQRGFLTNGQL